MHERLLLGTTLQKKLLACKSFRRYEKNGNLKGTNKKNGWHKKRIGTKNFMFRFCFS